MRTSLHGLVGVVAGIQVREDEDRGPSGHFGVRQLGPCHVRIDRSVVLYGTFDQQVRGAFLGESRGRADPLHLRSRAGCARRVGQHRDPRLDAELSGRLRRGDRNVSELFGGRFRDDRAVAVDQYSIGQAHQEDARDRVHTRLGLDELQRRADRVSSGVDCTGDHAVRMLQMHHHRAEVRQIRDDLPSPFDGHSLVGAQFGVLGCKLLYQVRVVRRNDLGRIQIKSKR